MSKLIRTIFVSTLMRKCLRNVFAFNLFSISHSDRPRTWFPNFQSKSEKTSSLRK